MAVDTKHVLAKIEEQLLIRGFTKQKYGIFVKQVSEDVQGSVGLNRAIHSGTVEINMVIGITEKRIEARIAELLGEKLVKPLPVTIAGNVGYLRKEEHYFAVFFDNEKNIEKKVLELMKAFDSWGWPFIEKNSRLSSMIETMMTSRVVVAEFIAYRLPIALDISGRRDEAITTINDRLKLIEARKDPAAERYRKFAVALLRELS
jgi:hypothetical protein